MTKRTQMNKSVAPTPSNKLLTPANVITLIRICLVPIFVVVLLSPWPAFFNLDPIFDETQSLFAAGIFILISATDWLDGYLARSRNEVTDFGKFMDPLADKILVTAALLALIELGALPSWVVLVILAREFIVSGVRMVAASEGVVIAASWYGKAKTVSQMFAIVLFTIKESGLIGSIHAHQGDSLWIFSWLVMIIALVLTIVSMLDYISKARHLIAFGRAREELCQHDPKDAVLPLDCTKDRDRTQDQVQTHTQDQVQAHTHTQAQAYESTMVLHTDLSESEHISTYQVQNTLKCSNASSNEVSRRDKLSVECSAAANRVLIHARKRGVTLATAESLTGGMIAQYLTSIAGSSDVVVGGVVSYAEEVKEKVLDVPSEVIAHEGVVSELTAQIMAEGALRKLQADVAVSVTGIAGPSGAKANKPVGMVCFAAADCDGFLITETQYFQGDRDEVRLQTTLHALCLMERVLLCEHTYSS